MLGSFRKTSVLAFPCVTYAGRYFLSIPAGGHKRKLKAVSGEQGVVSGELRVASRGGKSREQGSGEWGVEEAKEAEEAEDKQVLRYAQDDQKKKVGNDIEQCRFLPRDTIDRWSER